MDDRFRASDADRDRAAALLGHHFAAGRLTAEDLDERLTAMLKAKTFGRGLFIRRRHLASAAALSAGLAGVTTVVAGTADAGRAANTAGSSSAQFGRAAPDRAVSQPWARLRQGRRSRSVASSRPSRRQFVRGIADYLSVGVPGHVRRVERRSARSVALPGFTGPGSSWVGSCWRWPGRSGTAGVGWGGSCCVRAGRRCR